MVITLLSFYAIPKVTKAFSFRDLLPNFSVRTGAQIKSKVDITTKDSAVKDSRVYTDSRFNSFDNNLNSLKNDFGGLKSRFNSLESDVNNMESNRGDDDRGSRDDEYVDNPLTEDLDLGGYRIGGGGDISYNGEFSVYNEGNKLFSVSKDDNYPVGFIDVEDSQLRLFHSPLVFEGQDHAEVFMSYDVPALRVGWDYGEENSASYYFSKESLDIWDARLNVNDDFSVYSEGNKLFSVSKDDNYPVGFIDVAEGSQLRLNDGPLIFAGYNSSNIFMSHDVPALRVGWDYGEENSASYYFSKESLHIWDGNLSIYDGNLGIGTDNPNRKLHIKTNSNDEFINAEIGIQSGNNTHWGIYQEIDSGNLKFWNVEDRVVFTDEGIETDKIDLEEVCLNGVCIDNWRDLQRLLNMKY